MPLQIVRDDITRIRVDAVVNSTNRHLQMGGHGVDFSIHNAAGPRLQQALNEIAWCETGSAVITPSYDMENCRYIIHAVPPVYFHDPENGRELLKQTYESIFSIAAERELESIAVPILSSGANGWPRDEAYGICCAAARRQMQQMEKDLMVYIVLHDRWKSVVEGNAKIKEKADVLQCAEIKASYFVEPHYREESRREDWERENLIRPKKEDIEACFMEQAAMPGGRPEAGEEEREILFQDLDLSFTQMCEYWADVKSIKMTDFYLRANLTRQTFWRMKNHQGTQAKKTMVLACAIGLRLTTEETDDLLHRAGYALSDYLPLDRIVREALENEEYDIDRINIRLYDEDQPTLGYNPR